MFNTLIVQILPFIPKPIVHAVAKRYIAGSTLESAIATTRQLAVLGASTTIDVLGEFVTSKERAIHETSASRNVIEAIADNNLDSYLSVKCTSLGMDIDDSLCWENISGLVSLAKSRNVFVRLDMENSPYTTKTLNLYRRLREHGFENVGVVLQAYLHRTETDIRELAEFKPSIRLCKGIYVEDGSIAFKPADEIRANYKRLLRLIVENGLKVGIATHDEELINDARAVVKNLEKSSYEFQMLLGVREDRRSALIKEGHRLRVYVPFGDDWYGYSIRRLKENPKVAGYIAKAVFTGK